MVGDQSKEREFSPDHHNFFILALNVFILNLILLLHAANIGNFAAEWLLRIGLF